MAEASAPKGEVTFFPYQWHHESTDENTYIHVFGLDEDNKDVHVIVDDFTPYVYIELPHNIVWSEIHKTAIINSILQKCWDAPPKSVQFVMKRRLYYANVVKKDGKTFYKKFPYLFVSFNSKKQISQLSFRLREPIDLQTANVKIRLKLHEHNALPFLQLSAIKDLPSAAWITAKGLEQTTFKESTCNRELTVSWRDIEACHREIKVVPRPRVMGMDIEANSTNPEVMPNKDKPGDVIFQIGCALFNVGDPEEKWDKHILSLKKLDQEKVGSDITIHLFKNEASLLEGYAAFIREMNPHIIVGYNIMGWDIPYMVDRAKRAFCFDEFCKQSAITGHQAEEIQIKWSSSAFSIQQLSYIDAFGRLYVDMLPVIRRDYKFSSYKLGAVSENILGKGITKDPLTPKGIFKCFKIGTPATMSLVGRYCVIDAILAAKLFEKTQSWIGLSEMANVCSVPIFFLYSQGQQVRVFSQVYKFCCSKGIVVEKDAFTIKEGESYTGATVYEPVPGLYENVCVLDFTSLYPSAMIASNLDYSTLADDAKIPDEDCHVIQWSDHIGCLAAGTSITLPNFNIPIEGLDGYKGKVYGWDPKQTGLIESEMTKFIDQGIKECVELTFQDGTKLQCTPDHRIMTNKNEWKEAKDLIIGTDKVSKGVVFPLQDYKGEMSDCKGWSLTIGDTIDYNCETVENYENALIFSRLLGLIMSDGTVADHYCGIFSGHLIDVFNIVEDIKILSGIDVMPVIRDHGWRITVPSDIAKDIKNIPGVITGKRTTQDSSFPEFIQDENCPLPILREFLAGLFGGDGHCPSYSKSTKALCAVKFTQSKHSENEISGIQMMADLSLLLKRFGIEATQIKPRSIGKTGNKIEVGVHIIAQHTVLFQERIGFKYCIHKSHRLLAAVSYYRSRNEIARQSNYVVERVTELKKEMTIAQALARAHQELKDTEPIYNIHYSLPSASMYQDKIRPRNQGLVLRMLNKHVPTVRQYLEDIGALAFFESEGHYTYAVDLYTNALPTIGLTVIYRKNIGPQKVYDLQIKETESFLANGIVVHNCSHDKVKRKTKVKKVMCAHRKYRFLKDPIGILPTILKNLLDARQKVKKQMKTYQKSDPMYMVLDKRQLATKISANSCRGDVPIPCLLNGIFDYRVIEELSRGDWVLDQKGNERASPLPGLSVWSDTGFTPVKHLIRHSTENDLVRVLTVSGCVDVTTDHSLLTPEKQPVSAGEVWIGGSLCHRPVAYHLDAPSDPLGARMFQQTVPTVEEAVSWNIPEGLKSYAPKGLTALSYVKAFEWGRYLSDHTIKEITPEEKVFFFSRNGTRRVPTLILNAPLQLRSSFAYGFYCAKGIEKHLSKEEAWGVQTFCYQSSSLGAACLVFLLKSIGYSCEITLEQALLGQVYKLLVRSESLDKPNLIKDLTLSPPEPGVPLSTPCVFQSKTTETEDFKVIYHSTSDAMETDSPRVHKKEYVYDLETESHHFAAGVGDMIVHNSIYGSTGVEKGYLPCMPIAMCTAAIGRQSLAKSANFLTSDAVKGKLIYGDSVTGETPILCRYRGKAEYRQINSLPIHGRYLRQNYSMLLPDGSERRILGDKDIASPIEGLEVWSDKGFTPIVKVIRHQTRKQIYRISTANGCVHVTEDHSLLTDLAEKIRPSEVQLGTRLLHRHLPIAAAKKYLYSEQIVRNVRELGFDSQLEAAEAFLFFTSRNKTVTLKTSQGGKVESKYILMIRAAVDDETMYDEITEIQPVDYEGYVYDLETENHHFSAGIGELVVHNTDSCMMVFEDCKDRPELIKRAKQAEKDVSALFPPPMKMELEDEIYDEFMLLSKKRYIMLAHGELKKKGVLLARRDHSKFVQDAYTRLVMDIFAHKSEAEVLGGVLETINQLYSHVYPSRDFVITKSVGEIADYKTRALSTDEKKRQQQLAKSKSVSEEDYAYHSLPAHVQLGERLRRRGQIVEPGSRLEYVVTSLGGPKAPQWMKLEDITYFESHRDILEIDFNYYCKAMINPFDEVISIFFEQDGWLFKHFKDRMAKYEMIQQLRGLTRCQIKLLN